MPQVGVFIAAWMISGLAAAGVGFTVAGAAAALSALSFVVNAVLVAGISALGMKAMMPSMSDLAGQLSAPVEPMPSKRFVYGETRVGGNYVYIGTSQAYTDSNGGDGPRDKLLHMVVEVAGHAIEEYLAVYFNGEELNLSARSEHKKTDLFPNKNATDANGVTRYQPVGDATSESSLRSYLGFKFYDGTQTQADADLVAAMAYSDDALSANHIGKGRAYVYIRAHYNPELFSGFPEFSFKIKGKNNIYDPRGGGSTGYTTNSALIAADYLTESRDSGGVGADWSEIDETVLTASANICDETPQVYEDGTTQDRYFVGGSFNTSEEPARILAEINATMAGWVERVNGKWHIEAGAYSAPAMTLTESEMRDRAQVNLNLSYKDIANSVKPAVRAPESDWQPSLARSVEALTNVNVTPDHTTDTFTAVGHGLSNGDRLKFVAWTGTAIDNTNLPAGLSETAWYYVINAAADTFQISLTSGGSAVNLTSNGTGTIVAQKDNYLSKDTERKTAEIVFSLVPDQTLARRLALISLLQTRQEITASLKCKLGTAWATPFDLKVGDSVRWIDAHKDFWEAVADGGTRAIDASGTVTHASHGLSNGDQIVVTDADSSGLRVNHPYYVVNATTDTFGIANYRGGTQTVPAEATDIAYSTIQGKLFRVMGWQLVFDDGVPGINLELQETASNIYTWASGYETAPATASSITVTPTRIVDDPTGLAVASGTDQLLIRKDGTIVSRAKLTWDATTDAYTEQGGYVDIEYKETTTQAFTTNFAADANQFNSTAHGLSDGDLVYFRSTGTLPAGIDASTGYYVVNSATDTFEVSTDFDGTPVTLTSDGTGTHVVDDQTQWQSWGDVTGSATVAYIADLNDGTDYDFRIRFRNSFGAKSEWDTVIGHTLVGKTANPTDPTSFTAIYDSTGYKVNLAWTDPPDLDLKDIAVWRRIGATGSYEYVASVIPGVEQFVDLVTPGAADVVYYYQIKAYDTSGNESNAVSANDTVDKVPEPASFNLTVGASQYYEFDADWTAGAAGDWFVLQWWFTQDSDNKQVVWAPYDAGNVAVACPRYYKPDGTTLASMEITARAWHVTFVRGVQVISAATSNDTVTANRWPAPTAAEMTMTYTDPSPGPASSQSSVTATLPTANFDLITEVQLWSNVDQQNANTLDTLGDSDSRNFTTLTFPSNTWATAAAPSDTWPTFGVFYYRNGLPSEADIVNFTMPADDTGSPYTFN